MAAPKIHKSPEVKFRLKIKFIFPLLIIVITPVRQSINPIILERFILSLKNKTDKIIIKIGEDV